MVKPQGCPGALPRGTYQRVENTALLPTEKVPRPRGHAGASNPAGIATRPAINNASFLCRVHRGAMAVVLLSACTPLLAQTTPTPDTTALPDPITTLPAEPVVPPPLALDAPDEPVLEVSRPPALLVSYSRSGISGGAMKPEMDDLRVVRLQETGNEIGRQVALNVALMLFTGGGALGIRIFAKEDFKGVPPEDAVDIERLKNPALKRLTAELERRSNAWLSEREKTRSQRFARPLVVSAATWRLVYSALNETLPTYQLRFEVGIYKSRDKPSFFTGDKRGGHSCNFVSDARPMDAWKAGDYQAVVDLEPKAVVQCAEEFTAQLPQLLELEAD
jgi:hypothetical protein